MKNITGFKDRYGHALRVRAYMTNAFTQTAESFGHEPLAVSSVERAEAYSEDVIGDSPWPEWDARSCFFIPIDDYDSSYESSPSRSQAILIPEGTVSVTRWFGDRLRPEDLEGINDLGLKIYYDSECFRNEPLESLWSGKGRSFSQFGVEILCATGAAADLEPLVIAHESLRALGVPSEALRIRLSSNRLYLALADASSLTKAQRVVAKEALDTIAECKAGKKPERFDDAAAKLRFTIKEAAIEESLERIWEHLISRPTGPITEHDYAVFSPLDGTEDMQYLQDLSESLIESGILIEVDLCVVRSHEYYTGFTFEIDVVGKDGRRHVEVGGGGRYDRLLADFAPKGFPEFIPSTGFAFGVERLQVALEEGGYLTGGSVITSRHLDLDEIPRVESMVLDETSDRETAKAYLDTVRRLREQRVTNRVSVTAPGSRYSARKGAHTESVGITG